MFSFLLISACRNPSARGVPRASSASHGAGVVPAAAIAKIEDLNQKVVEMKLTIDGLERERDFYFAKLRDIEVLNITKIVSVLTFHPCR